jgi:Alpha/beta hydrolase family
MGGSWVRREGNTTPPVIVVFIHGILSDNESCWLHTNGTFWPSLLAGHSPLSTVGIYDFTYHTNVFSGSYSLGDVVDALKESLTLDNVIAARRIIFVAHSMGGIVVRRYIVQRHVELIERGTEVGLFLVASPSLGSPYATWLAPIAKFMGHSQGAALTFCEQNSWLNDLNTDFRNLLARGKLVVYGKELVEDNFIILKRIPLFKQVVPPFSGALYFGDSIKIAASDHFSIAKPEGPSAFQHRLLCQFIESLVQTAYDATLVYENNGELRTRIGNCEICVVSGRIEEYEVKQGSVVALPCNEYFDDRCTADSRSALGIYVARHFAGHEVAFSALVQGECSKRFGNGTVQQKTNDEAAKSFGPGRAILLTNPLGKLVSVALIATTTQRAGQGLAARISYLFDGMRELFALLADERIDEVVMPVLGAGHGGIDPPLALVGLVLALAEAAQNGTERQRRKRVVVVVFRPSASDAPTVAAGVVRRALSLVADKH